MDKILKDNVYFLTKSITVLNGEIDRLSGEVGALKNAIMTLVDRMEKNNVLKRLEGKS